ncbi:hypothetical protein [Streptomyces spongiae]|uniref:Uncharacterized protein n=1 Tax=Streptomyces spongiae TaxID=565072 RepID=A0A5N8XII8_9ACTN|nr:hypothetical protein [Streptomyces spongiae]MPY58385.1 hypothetical protein [Streptomyces spongiae]
MVTFSQLLELDVAGLERFADQWNDVIHRKVRQAREQFHDDVVRKLHRDHWRGEGGEAAQKYCDRVQVGFDALDAQVKSLSRFLDEEADGVRGTGGTEGLEGLQEIARELDRDAREAGMRIAEDGVVEWSNLTEADDPDGEAKYQKKKQAADLIQKRAQKVLKEVNEIDEWLTTSLKVVFGTPHNFETEDRRYNVFEPTVKDHIVRRQLNNVGAAASVRGWPNAAGLVKHYLDGSGKTVEVEPQQLMRDIPQFQRDVDKTLEKDVRKRPDGPFTTEWGSTAPVSDDGETSRDWYYALNHFQYRLVGEKHGDEITYRVDVRKRYDWGVPSEHRRTQDQFKGPFKVELEQADLAHLNSVGLARDFNVRGSSDTIRTSA